jgi:hypothetical protein
MLSESIGTYYGRALEREMRRHGTESGWLRVGELPVTSGEVLIIDVSFVPRQEEGLVVNVPPGAYRVDATLMDYGADRRVSRLRLVREGAGIVDLGSRLGRTWIDTGRTGICDLQVFRDAWGDDDQRSYRRISDKIEGRIPYGVAVLDEATRAVLPFVESGFGDGEYPVRELLEASGGSRVGLEVLFIRSSKIYPFLADAS